MTETARSFARLALATRTYGQCYVRVALRKQAPFVEDGIEYTVGSWGRSLMSRTGHKYKVWARYRNNCLPAPSKVLQENLFQQTTAEAMETERKRRFNP